MAIDRVPERTGKERQKRFQPPTVPDSLRMIGYPDVLKHPAELRCPSVAHVRLRKPACQCFITCCRDELHKSGWPGSDSHELSRLVTDIAQVNRMVRAVTIRAVRAAVNGEDGARGRKALDDR